jgi:hypothetical protein
MTLPAELQVGRRARAPSGTVTDRDRTRQMVARDRIRLTGRLREGSALRGLSTAGVDAAQLPIRRSGCTYSEVQSNGSETPTS